MKSKLISSQEEARRLEIESKRQGTPFSIGGSISTTSFDRTLAWLRERSAQAAQRRMADAQRIVTVPPPAGMEPPKRAPYVAPKKPAEIGDVIESVMVDGFSNRVVNRIKRIVGIE
jgi:hypothetical protein